MAAAPTSGHVYVLDQLNNRVDEFTAWGSFRLAWGWGVANGAAELQQCGPAASPPSSCQAGLAGEGVGQIPELSQNALAVDSTGAIYLYSTQFCGGCGEANRVQKFDADGNFILTFGREVNLTEVALRESQEQNSEPVTVSAEEENICTAASGDQCGPGTLGSGDGQFGTGPLSPLEPFSYDLAVGPGDKVYVGGQERVQVFAATGNHLETIALAAEQVRSLAVMPDGTLVVIPISGDKVEHRSAAGALLCTAAIPLAREVAAEADEIFVLAGAPAGDSSAIEVRKLDSACAEDTAAAFSPGPGSSTSGIAANVVTQDGQPGLYVTGDIKETLKAFSPPPDRPQPFDQAPQVPPSIESQFIGAVGSETAEAFAQINPHFFADTTYYVEYGPEPCGDVTTTTCTKAPLGPALLGAGRSGNPVRTAPITLTGLQPGTVYFFRFVSESEGGGPARGVGGLEGIDGSEAEFSTFAPQPMGPVCPNAAFRGGPSAHLSRCRAYELVSPVEKNGGDVAANAAVKNYGTLAEAADSGDRATFSSVTAFQDPASAPLVSQFLSERTSSGWATQSISAPRGLAILGIAGRGRYKSFTPDLCGGWFLQDSNLTLTPDAPVGYPEAYRRSNCSDPFSYQALVAAVPQGFPANSFNDPEFSDYVEPLGSSVDGQFSVFRAPTPLTSNACKSSGIVQTYERGPEGVRLISVLPNGKGSCSHSSAGTFFGTFDQINFASTYHAVSSDGSTVYWSENGNTTSVIAGAGPDQTGGAGRLLVRLNAQAEPGKCSEPGRACTQEVSPAGAVFAAATPDGSQAIYTTNAEGESVPSKLYRYDLNTNTSSLLAEIPAAEVGPNGYLGVIGASQDLSRIYLVATANFTGGQTNSEGQSAQVGRSNIYLYEGGAMTFVATLGKIEGRVNNPSPREGGFPASPRPIFRSSRVSTDGSTLAFTSSVQLTKHATADRNSNEPDAEVYMFRAGSGNGTLTCVSCSPSGARPTGQQIGIAENGTIPIWAASTLPGWAESGRPSRLLAEDGSYLFFQSFDQLTPGDHNSAQDVYEWQSAASRAQCNEAGAEAYSAGAGGCLTLISSGTSPQDSELIDASSKGSDVFFMTAASLLPQDPGQVDMYDARRFGGFPAVAGPAQPCQGAGCRVAPPPPGPASPASTVKRAGNPKQAGCPKGKKRVKAKHGKTRCVKKPSKNQHHKHEKKGSKKSATKKSGGRS